MAAFAAAIAAGASAQPMAGMWGAHMRSDDRAMLEQAVKNVLDQYDGKTVSDLTGADLEQALGQLSVAEQEYAWVRRSEIASAVFPGAGQLMNGDVTAGSLYIAGSVALFAGTLVGGYFLLPQDLQFGSTNYLTDSYASIKTKWEDHSLEDYLPTAAVFAGGMILRHVLGHFASAGAADDARKSIQNKSITFEPEPYLLAVPDGREMMGIGMRMRF
jgi:hypothetical protein